jgi:toxin-antitoxin system PIN domain toxin
VSVTVDANVLLYASDESSAYSPAAADLLRDLAAGPEIVYLFWPVAMSYMRIATHHAIFRRPLTAEEARSNVDALVRLPHVRTPGEGERFWELFRGSAGGAGVRGNLVPDAHVVALMLEHDVGAIWTHDRDFRRFDGIEVRDPFA